MLTIDDGSQENITKLEEGLDLPLGRLVGLIYLLRFNISRQYCLFVFIFIFFFFIVIILIQIYYLL